jgi:hypothetical protein
MSAKTIREKVELFQQKSAHGESSDNCFAPWYLHEVFGLAESEAIKHSAETETGFGGPGYDYNVDAFHIEYKGDIPSKLILIQAKYSSSLNYIAKGMRDFSKTIDWLRVNLHSDVNEINKENKVLINLRAQLQSIPMDIRETIGIELILIHLSEEDKTAIDNKIREAKNNIYDELKHSFISHNHRILLQGPYEILKMPEPERIPPPKIKISFSGTTVDSTDGQRMRYGIGLLSEIVDIYKERKDNLFSKNVRLFLKSRKNIEKGPSGKIRETLKAICIDSEPRIEPSEFSFLHNGLTILASDTQLTEESLYMREPYVLNGCQSITTAFLFRYGERLSSRINTEKWKQIKIPIRVIDSADENFIRMITISTNRQNSISASALRANDPVQIRLENSMARMEIFYERQEGAFDYLQDVNPKRISQEFQKSEWGPVFIDDIARSIAAASGEIALAKNVTDLFESDTAYEKIFSNKKLASIRLLILLQNIHNVLPLVIRNDIGLNWRDSHVKSGKVIYNIFCLLIRHITKEKLYNFVDLYSDEIVGRNVDFRREVSKLLDNRHSGIKGELQNRVLCLQNGEQVSINEAFRKIEVSLRLNDSINCFEFFKDYDSNF